MPATYQRRNVLAGLASLPLLVATPAAIAAPTRYTLQKDRSTVGFIYRLSGVATKGAMPVTSAQVMIDLDALARSSIDVTVNAARAKAGLIFATEALKAPSVLDVKRHPSIRFRSTAIRLNGQGNLASGAKIDGQMTIRGVTKPVTLNAALFRQAGTNAGDRSRLSFQVKGRVSRKAFGATGYADLVDDAIDLDITARVIRA